MNRPCDEFFTRSTFAPDEDRGIGWRCFVDELIDLAHASTVPHHAVFDIESFLQAAILAFEPFHVPGMFEGHSGNRRNRRQKMQVMFVEMLGWTRGVGVNDA